MKWLPYILFEKCINILALEKASPWNRHCAKCIGTLSFPIHVRMHTVDSCHMTDGRTGSAWQRDGVVSNERRRRPVIMSRVTPQTNID